ncbi:MAG: hypothetical protein Q9162_004186 [Coniocarpon cinnabarinum]
MADSLSVAAEETRKLRNPPSVVEGNQILEALNSLKNDMNSLKNDMNSLKNDVKDIKLEINRVNQHLDRLDANSVARLHNNSASRRLDSLVPLRNQRGEEIAGFPTTVGALESLNSGQLNHLIENLGGQPSGTLAYKRNQIKILIGMQAARDE